MKRTVSIPIEIEPSIFLPLLERCAEIFNAHVDWALDNKTYNKSKAHAALYQQMKEQHPHVPTAFIQAVRDTAMEAVKATAFKKRPRKKKHSGLRFDKRTMTVRGEQLSLSTLGKRERIILKIPDYFRPIFDSWKLKGATLTYSIKAKQFWIRLVYETETPALKTDGAILGIDRGIRQLAVTSDGQFFSNGTIRAAQRRYLYNRKTAQAKGTPSSRRRLKAMGGKEKRFSRDINHCVTKALVNQNNVTTFVLEDLSGIRNKRRGRKLNKHIGSWPFYQFELFLVYKAEALGKGVVFVDARYTSQRCNRCGHIERKNRIKSVFHCVKCGHRDHSDKNAAKNIRDRYLLSAAATPSVEQGIVNYPDVTDALMSQGLVTSPRPCAGGN